MIERKESPSSSSVALRERPTRRMPSRSEPMSAAQSHACRKLFLGKSTASYSDGVMLRNSQLLDHRPLAFGARGSTVSGRQTRRYVIVTPGPMLSVAMLSTPFTLFGKLDIFAVC